MEHDSTILIVDDEPPVREIIAGMLMDHGYYLAIAGSGSEAIARAVELTPDLILLDVMMPDIDGFEVCRRLRADPLLAEVPIVMITALNDRDSRLKGIEAGADDFISKPFSQAELQARVRTITRLNRYRRLLLERTQRQQAEMETAQLYQKLQQYADGLEATVAQRTLELQRERDRTQSILEALGEAVVVADWEGTIQYVNPAAVTLSGFTSDEAVGQDWQLWHRDAQSAKVYAEMQAVLRSGQTWRGELVYTREDGTPYDAAVTVAPLFDSQDRSQPVGFVGVQRDITPIKEAQRLKEQFISNVSHELRTPLSILTLVSGNLDTLYDRLDDEKRRKMIRDIREHTQTLNSLVGNVLEISRLDSRRAAPERQLVDLARLARDEAQRQLPLIQKKSQVLSMVGVESLEVWGNEGQLRQVVSNLLNNAIKYTSNQGYLICECQMRAGNIADSGWPGSADLPDGCWAALRVVDAGIGISQEDVPHLFERFYRVKAQGNIPGTGLGLPIARELVELHAGHIAVTSTPGQGSIFAIYLPLSEKEENRPHGDDGLHPGS
jgi:two-component system cell cycle sensor histidine kinase/response regulator CckA